MNWSFQEIFMDYCWNFGHSTIIYNRVKSEKKVTHHHLKKILQYNFIGTGEGIFSSNQTIWMLSTNNWEHYSMSNNMYYSFTQPSLLYVWETQSSRDVGKFLSLVKSADKIYSVVFPLWISSYLRPYCPRGLQHSQFMPLVVNLEVNPA